MYTHAFVAGKREEENKDIYQKHLHEVIWSTSAFGQRAQSELLGIFLVTICGNASLGQKLCIGGLGWPAGGEHGIDLGRSIVVPRITQPRYSHVCLTISFNHIPLLSNKFLLCLSNWVKYVLLAAKNPD